ncbi:hypothetical protein DVB69_04985 [Sporosarcina sp. BI001-red]|uniref:hypothetical protein n=1 Tax=Sporosarcina sp. BI001-red TaxID=2282866 RepID=UPI000E26F032|nr:hypothetical protein [Sporosarcina sp. BI001-red]REB08498.1 hypothetical protein DVB69_04985 [Sporosarcina sp. BI001-red]
MLKKVLPAALVAGFVLAGCGNANKDVPDKNETPMEDVENHMDNDRARDWSPDTEGNAPNGTTGPNLDGVDDDRNGGMNDGVLNNDGVEDNTLEGAGSGEGGTMGENSTPGGGNSAETGNNGGSPKKDDKGMSDGK